MHYEAVEDAIRRRTEDAPQTEANTESAGGSRFSAGKPQMWMAPWGGMMEVCRVAEFGAKKYAPMDYRSGQSFSTLLNSGMRHLLAAIRDPQSRDPESGLLHLGHLAWNVLCLLDHLASGRDDLDDITPWQGVTARTHRGVWSGSGDKP